MNRYPMIFAGVCLVALLCVSVGAQAATIDSSSSNAGLANNPDLVYNPTNGNVRIYADGANMGSFVIWSSGMFTPPAGYTALTADTGYPSGPTDNSATVIGWVSGGSLFGVGFDGPAGSVNTPYADLGNIFPTGLDQAGLTSLLTDTYWSEPIGGTIIGGTLDFVALPEPNTLVLSAIGLAGWAVVMLKRVRGRRRLN